MRLLVDRDHDITVLHRGETEAVLPSPVQHIHADRADQDALRQAVESLAPTVVIDMGAMTEADATGLVRAARGAAGRLVVISSQDVYRAYGRFHGTEAGPIELDPATEDSPLRTALYPYRGKIAGLDAYEKVLVERALAGTHDLPATVLRLPATYGEGDGQHRLALELRRMDDGRPAILVDETLAAWRWTRSYVENAAAAIVRAATDERAPVRVYNVGDHAMPYVDWLRAIGRAAGWQGEVVPLPTQRLPKHLRPPHGEYAQHLVADTTRIRGELGYEEPVPFEDGLRRSIAWERANRVDLDPRLLDYEAEDVLLASLP